MKTTYSEQENKFLRKYYNNYSWEELTKRLNKQFGTQRKFRTVKTHCRAVLHLKKTFSQDHYRNCNIYNIGDEIIENGYVLVKVNNIKGSREKRSRGNWVQKHRLIWEQHYGKIPNDCQIIFLDGDTFNFDIDNLYCVERRLISVLNRNNRELDLKLKRECQAKYEETHTRAEFMALIGRNYLD